MDISLIFEKIKLLSAHSFASCEQTRNGEHYKNQYSYKIIVYTSGSAYVEIGNKSQICRAGDAVFLLPGNSYRILNKFGDFSVINIYFGFSKPLTEQQYIEQKYFNAAKCEKRLFFPNAELLNTSFFARCPSSVDAAKKLLRATDSDFAAVPFIQKSLLCFIIGELLSISAEMNDRKSAIARCIDDNLAQINAKTAADMLKIHPVQLNRLIKKYMNCTTSEYIMNKKIERAKLYLAESGMNITEIAYSLGFFDSAHFSGAFKRHVGVSPTEYKMGMAIKSIKP